MLDSIAQESSMYQRILVPIDGSPTAQRGLEEAIRLAKAFDAAVVFHTVIEPPPMPIGAEMGAAVAWEQIASIYEQRAKQVLDSAHSAATAAGIASEAHLEGPIQFRVCDAIVAQARKHRCDLIVMGTHGRRGLSHALIGSDAERVVRQAPCAVLIVRHPEARA
jgi:nucleotide-binding universal stress UspA family protein